jgi:hypothetical protein
MHFLAWILGGYYLCGAGMACYCLSGEIQDLVEVYLYDKPPANAVEMVELGEKRKLAVSPELEWVILDES